MNELRAMASASGQRSTPKELAPGGEKLNDEIIEEFFVRDWSKLLANIEFISRFI